MRPRHLLLLAPLLLAAGCADQTASDPSTDTAVEASAVDEQEEAMTDGSGQPATEDLMAWETDGPVDEAAATARDLLLKDLDTLRKSGEKMFLTQPELTDEAVRDAVVDAAAVTSEVAADGATGIRVTATEGKTSCTGTLAFKSGAGTWDGVSCS